MTNKVLLAFAMKEELAPWRRRHRFSVVPIGQQRVSVTSIGATEVYVALVGAGCADVNVVHDLAGAIKPSVAIISGVAAGLKPQWRPGDILVAHTVRNAESETTHSSERTLMRLAMGLGAKPETIITLPRILRTPEEKILFAKMGDAVDMESLNLMKHFAARGLPSLGLRVILDPVEMPMTCDFESALDSHGQVRIAKILGQLVRHPSLLPDFLHLAKQSRRVLSTLALFLDNFLGDFDRNSRPLDR